ncbi:NEW3 domain-containing protein, partial [Candidatus Aenigmatarchaeota archaeon]
YQGDSQYIYYMARDAAEGSLPGVNVNLSVYDPDNRSLYIFTGHEYTTDSSGEVTETLFIVPSHSSSGNYTIVSNASYYDTDVGLWIDNQTNYTFSVGEDEELTAKVSVPQFVYINYMMPVSIIILEGYNEPVDPDTINLTIYRTEGYNLDQWRSLDMGSLNRSSTGFYTYNEVLTGGVLSGSYLAVLRVTKGDKETFDIWPFRISSSGPYDVIITNIDSEVQQGGILNFDLYVENMGEVSNTDVNITYWVADGQTWYMTMFQANINAGENRTFSRTANIFSNQPVGNYYLNVRVKYDPTTEAAVSNSSFRVTAAGDAPPPGPPGGGGESTGGAPAGGPGGEAAGAISITGYENEVGVEIGVQKLVNVVVENIGGTVLKDVKLEISGPGADWITVEPLLVESLKTGSQTVFTLKIMVPRGESSGQFNVKMTADSSTAGDSKMFSLFVFTSRKDLIEFELIRLKAKLEELENDADKFENQGIDVSDIRDKLGDAENKIDIAEEYLNRQLYDASLDAVYTAWKLLKEAEDMLDNLGEGGAIPWWIIILIIVIIGVVIAGFFINKMLKNMKTILRGRMSEARKVAETVKGSGAEIDHLKEEKMKTQRMMDLLDDQRKQGIISKEAYDSLIKRSEEKMKELDKKIRKGLSI